MLAGIEIVCQQLSADGTDSHWNVRVLSYTYDCDYSKRTFSLVTTKRKKRKKKVRGIGKPLNRNALMMDCPCLARSNQLCMTLNSIVDSFFPDRRVGQHVHRNEPKEDESHE